MKIEQHVREWWNQRPTDQRELLRAAAKENRMDAATLKLLIDTRCPMGPVGTKWDQQPEYDWSWASDVREIILKSSETYP